MIDIKKKYKTRNGLPFYPVTDQGRGQYPIIGYIGDGESVKVWTRYGKYSQAVDGHQYDLVEVKEKKVMYVNVHKDGDIYAYDSAYTARQHCPSGFVACIRVEYEEGQFDD